MMPLVCAWFQINWKVLVIFFAFLIAGIVMYCSNLKELGAALIASSSVILSLLKFRYGVFEPIKLVIHKFSHSLRVSYLVRNSGKESITNAVPIMEVLKIFKCDTELKELGKQLYVITCEKHHVLCTSFGLYGKSISVPAIRKIYSINDDAEVYCWVDGGAPGLTCEALSKLATPDQYIDIEGLFLSWATPKQWGVGLGNLKYCHVTDLPVGSFNEVNILDLYIFRFNIDGTQEIYLVLRVHSEYGADVLPRIIYAVPIREDDKITISIRIRLSGENAIDKTISDSLSIHIKKLDLQDRKAKLELKGREFDIVVTDFTLRKP